MNRVVLSFVLMLSGLLQSGSVLANGEPPCMDQGHELSVNNSDVLKWKTSTPNQFLARAHVMGVVSKIYEGNSGHDHFQILLDGKAGDTLEIIYNVQFGSLGEVKVGQSVEACGDYITSIARAKTYPASPDGAILHWVHSSGRVRSTTRKPRGHESGYLEINDVVYGQLRH